VFIEFETHPDGVPVTVNTRQVTTVGPDPSGPARTLIRFSDGRAVVVRGTKAEVMAKLEMSDTIRNPKKGLRRGRRRLRRKGAAWRSGCSGVTRLPAAAC
jgi:hypothetical protein